MRRTPNAEKKTSEECFSTQRHIVSRGTKSGDDRSGKSDVGEAGALASIMRCERLDAVAGCAGVASAAAAVRCAVTVQCVAQLYELGCITELCVGRVCCVCWSLLDEAGLTALLTVASVSCSGEWGDVAGCLLGVAACFKPDCACQAAVPLCPFCCVCVAAATTATTATAAVARVRVVQHSTSQSTASASLHVRLSSVANAANSDALFGQSHIAAVECSGRVGRLLLVDIAAHSSGSTQHRSSAVRRSTLCSVWSSRLAQREAGRFRR